jgi:hypothetical protein
MALEIGEIGINVRVGDAEKEKAEKKKKKAEKEKAKKGRGTCCDFDRQELVDDCVRLVLQALKAARER